MSNDDVILVVEDDYDIRDALSDILEDEGYGVFCVENGREALEWLGEHPAPALILLDLMMPGFDGFRFREVQRADPALARIPVVVLTADRRAHEHQADLEAAGYLTKPVDLDELLDVVRRLA